MSLTDKEFIDQCWTNALDKFLIDTGISKPDRKQVSMASLALQHAICNVIECSRRFANAGTCSHLNQWTQVIWAIWHDAACPLDHETMEWKKHLERCYATLDGIQQTRRTRRLAEITEELKKKREEQQ